MQGFRSRTGVPSTASRPWTSTSSPRTARTRHTEDPRPRGVAAGTPRAGADARGVDAVGAEEHLDVGERVEAA